MKPIKVGLIQMAAGPRKADNVERALTLAHQAAKEGATVIALPENFHLRAGRFDHDRRLEAAEPIPGGLSNRLAAFAKDNTVWFLAGSFGEVADGKRVYNTSLLYSPDGAIRAKYRKIHLFDVEIAGGVEARESDSVVAGDAVVTAETDFGNVGLAICYDVRFPDLFRIMAERGACLAFVPSNFALHTGRDHWEPLLRARAIENGMFIVAPAQIGKPENHFEAYGRSLVVDPWGTVLACAPDCEGVLYVTIDLDQAHSVRKSLPSLRHRRPDVYQSS